MDLPPPPPPLESPPPPPPPDDEYESSSGYSFPQTEGSGAVDRQGNLPETATGDTTQEVGTVAEEQEEKEEEIPPLFREDVYDELIFEENDDDVSVQDVGKYYTESVSALGYQTNQEHLYLAQLLQPGQLRVHSSAATACTVLVNEIQSCHASLRLAPFCSPVLAGLGLCAGQAQCSQV